MSFGSGGGKKGSWSFSQFFKNYFVNSIAGRTIIINKSIRYICLYKILLKKCWILKKRNEKFLLLFFIIFETEKFLGGGEKEVYVFEKSMQKK